MINATEDNIDLKAALDRAGRNLVNALCPDKRFLPYWHMTLDNDYRGAYKFRDRCNSHNVGRWWAALLPLEAATDFEIRADVEAGQLANVARFVDNPAGILLDLADHPEDAHDATKWYIHSFRETMLTLAALARYRHNRRAVALGRRAVQCMDQASQDLTAWHFASVSQPNKINHPVYSHGRSIEGLIAFYRATGESSALDLAGRYARYHLEHTVNAGGSLAPDHGNHTHSYLNTLRGLLLYGRVTDRPAYIQAVQATYHHAVQDMISRSGFITHDICVDKAQMCVGDPASAGDVAQIALLLWQQTRDGALLDDVERIVRARLLPTQIKCPPPVKPLQPGTGDEYRQLDERIVGALGGATGHTAGQTAVTDITAATLNSLIDIYNHIITCNDREIRVNLHFTCRNEFASVSSCRAETAQVCVTVFGPRNLALRVPRWTPIDSVRLTVNGAAQPTSRHGDYLCIAGQPAGLTVQLEYALPERVETESSRCQYFDTSERPRAPLPQPRTYTFQWRGDEVSAATPVDAYFPFYPSL